MLCRRCGKELGNSLRCKFCGYINTEGNVREMTRLEKNFYDGVTIDAESSEEQNQSNQSSERRSDYNGGNFYSSTTSSRRTYYTSSSPGIISRLFGKLFDGLFNNNLLAKVAATLIVVAISALMFFIAVPILFVMLALGIALFAFAKIGR